MEKIERVHRVYASYPENGEKPHGKNLDMQMKVCFFMVMKYRGWVHTVSTPWDLVCARFGCTRFRLQGLQGSGLGPGVEDF